MRFCAFSSSKLGLNLFCQLLAKLNAPLIVRVDIPNYTLQKSILVLQKFLINYLDENFVLVSSYKCAKSEGVHFFNDKRV